MPFGYPDPSAKWPFGVSSTLLNRRTVWVTEPNWNVQKYTKTDGKTKTDRKGGRVNLAFHGQKMQMRLNQITSLYLSVGNRHRHTHLVTEQPHRAVISLIPPRGKCRQIRTPSSSPLVWGEVSNWLPRLRWWSHLFESHISDFRTPNRLVHCVTVLSNYCLNSNQLSLPLALFVCICIHVVVDIL